MPDVFAGLPFTDAGFVERYCAGDFATLTARHNAVVASGTDGTIPAASFVLTSSTPFDVRGVQVGHVVVIDKYAGVDPRGNPKSVEASGEFPVTAVAGFSVTLGQFGLGPGQGDLPSGVTQTADATGIVYRVPTLAGLIRKAWEDVWRMLGIVTADDIVTPEGLDTITAYKVLYSLYYQMFRQKDDPWYTKMMEKKSEIAVELADLRGVYSTDTTQSMRPVSGVVPDLPAWRIPDDGNCGLGWPRRRLF